MANAYIRFNHKSREHRELTVRWQCLNDNCKLEFSAKLGPADDQGDPISASCPGCRAASQVIDEADIATVLDQLRMARIHTEAMLATIRQLYDGVRAEQSRNPASFLKLCINDDR